MSNDMMESNEAVAQRIADDMAQARPGRWWALPRITMAVAMAIAVVLLVFGVAGPAAAAGPFDEIGSKLGNVLCDFAHSPIVIVIAGAAFVGLFILMLTNEDKGILSTMLKIVVAALAIYNIAAIITWLGIGNIACGGA